MPTNGFSIKPLKVKLLAGEQKATKYMCFLFSRVLKQMAEIERELVIANSPAAETSSPEAELSNGGAISGFQDIVQ